MPRTLTSRRTAPIAVLAVAAACLAAAFLSGGPARAAVPQVITSGGSPIYGTCTGRVSGVIKGDAAAAGHAGQWNVSSVNDGLISPRDPATGLASGQVQHNQIRVTMPAGPQTVRLIQSLSTNEVLTSCQFLFYRPSATGVPTNYLKIQLTNAGLGSYALSAVAQSSAGTTFTFTYQHIMWTWVQGGTAASDSWAPAV